MSKNKLESAAVFALAFFLCASLFAQASLSTQSHLSSVTSLAYLEANGEASVLSAGKDGFLIKWKNDGNGEHYQVSDLPIKMISRSPNGYEVAIYESDGSSLNRVSVWNWRTFTRKFAYRFTDTITSLSYTAKGTYLMVGSASVNGLSMINASTGNIVSGRIPSGSGVVNFIDTSDTEKTAIAYSSKGALSYYNLLTGKQKAKYLTEDSLSQVGLFNNSVFLAGTRGNNIYVVQAVTGNTIGKYSAQSPVLITSNKIQDLYYIVNENHQFKVYRIQNDRNKAVIAPELVRTFSGLKDGEAVTCAAFAGEEFFAGTNSGNIYNFDYVQAERVDVVQPISDNMYENILDIASDGNDFYFLSQSSLFKSSYDNNSVSIKGLNSGYANIIVNGDNVVFWSKDTRKAVEILDISSGVSRTVFTPKSAVQVLRFFGNSLLDVEANSSVNIIDLATGNKKQVYFGSGIQDALATSEKDLYIAKSSASNPEVPLVYVNIETQETVPLTNVRGNIAYSLNFSAARQNEFYGVLIYTDARTKKLTTSVFAFDTSKKTVKNLLTISDEDNEASTYLLNSVLYTNIGKSQIRSYNLQTRKSFLYKRAASMPVKVAGNGNRIAVLNRDGSVSWYNPDMNNVLADWHMTADGRWIEF